jgi:hypothetical protein
MLRTFLPTGLLASLALVAGLCLASRAEATTIDFVIDREASSVTLNDTGGRCVLSRCGVSAVLDSDLNTGDTYTIGNGTTSVFDFLTFTGRGTGTDRFSIQAVLAFSSPLVSVTGSGNGAALLLVGNILSGVLTWTSVTPLNFTLPNGSEVAFNFQGGSGLFLGHSETSTASITGISIVPLPAGGLLLFSALAGIAALRRRKTA